MAHLITVERIKNERGENITATKIKLLLSVFPDYKDSYDGWNGVKFDYLDTGGFRFCKLTGIQLSAGDYGNKLIRRVMIKGDTIDADVLRQKYQEVKAYADEVEANQKASAERYSRVEAVYDSVIEKLGLTEERWHEHVHSDTETTVKIDGKTDWQGLKLIQETLNKPIVIEIKLSVPVEHAKVVYETLKKGGK